MVKSYELFGKKQNKNSKKCDHVTVEFMLCHCVSSVHNLQEMLLLPQFLSDFNSVLNRQLLTSNQCCTVAQLSTVDIQRKLKTGEPLF